VVLLRAGECASTQINPTLVKDPRYRMYTGAKNFSATKVFQSAEFPTWPRECGIINLPEFSRDHGNPPIV